jgi:hypothetical protein
MRNLARAAPSGRLRPANRPGAPSLRRIPAGGGDRAIGLVLVVINGPLRGDATSLSIGVVPVHDRALAEFDAKVAVRTQYAMLFLMVSLTGFGLIILARWRCGSSPTGATGMRS